MKIIVGVLALLIVVGGGFYAYWYFAVYQPQEQAYANFHQANENASAQGQKILNEAAQYGVVNYGSQNSSPTSSTAGSQQATSPSNKSSTPPGSTQFIMGPDNAFSIALPKSWTIQPSSGGNELLYSAPTSDSDYQPMIQIIWYSEQDEATCESRASASANSLSQVISNYSQSVINISGAIKAIMMTGAQSQGGNLIGVYACGGGRFYSISGLNLGASQSTAAANMARTAISTFKIL